MISPQSKLKKDQAQYHQRHALIILKYLIKLTLSYEFNYHDINAIYSRVYTKNLKSNLLLYLRDIPSAKTALESRSDCICTFATEVKNYQQPIEFGTLAYNYIDFTTSFASISRNEVSSVSRHLSYDDVQVMSDEQYYFNYLVQYHDLIHVLIDADTSIAGEAKVWSFLFAQVPFDYGALINALKLLLVAIFSFKDSQRVIEIICSMADGLRLGKKANLIFGVNWNNYLDEPLSEVKKIFNLS